VNQQLACAACVAAKGELPDSQAGFERMRATNPNRFDELTGSASGRLRLNGYAEDDLYRDALDSWVWPDESSDENGLIVLPGADTWNLFTFDVSARTQAALADRGLVRLQPLERDQGWATENQTKVWVVPDVNFINRQPNPADLQARVMRTILGWNLNYSNPADPTAEDRRVDNRTAALQTANTALTNLSALVSQVKDSQNKGDADDADLEHRHVAALLGFIRETLRSVGFWTVWAKWFVNTINNADDPLWSTYRASARRLLLYQLFVECEIDQRTPEGILPSKPTLILADDLDQVVISQEVLSGTDVNRLSSIFGPGADL
jgi:hypothetical protein